MRIEGRTAIITGASSGIGQATAAQLTQERANVVLASRNRKKLEALALDLVSLPGRTLVVPTDVTDRLAVEALVRKTAEEFGGVDVLVNNAGAGLFAPVAGGNPENMRRLFEVNFWGAVNCIQATVPYMQSQGRGHIVNVASIAAKITPPYMGMYSATKFALAAISDALRLELAGRGIGVSTIYPGLTQTSFMENMTQEVEVPPIPPVARFVGPDAVARRIVQAIRFGLRDAYISPEDIAAVGLNTFAPQLVDWTMRTFVGRPASIDSGDIEVPRPRLGRATAADSEPSEQS
ncbi:MAG TPA: SDR family NAD(P)-dependent oxidoreductase [Dehalococcoidia bacterium]|jgi:short-subunit dehydrogenase|nr:SDR family NAD(P)-dependent oxidoreductase [Dehalococcoidia bacterium]